MTTEDAPTPVKVAFRADKHGTFKGEITAVFSGEPGTRNGLDLMSYAHNGQHGACSPEWYRGRTRPATPEEYAPLLRELQRIGYAVTVVRRVHWFKT